MLSGNQKPDPLSLDAATYPLPGNSPSGANLRREPIKRYRIRAIAGVIGSCPWLVIGCLLLAACQSKHDQVQEASQSNPDVTPPQGPICTESLRVTNGGIAGAPERTLAVTIPEFDADKGDTALFYYKPSDRATWATFRPGFYADVSFSVKESVVTLTNHTNQQHDWMIQALITTCL